MSGLKWSIAIVALLALAAAGCEKKVANPAAGEFQKQRAALIEKQKSGQARAQAARAAKTEQGPVDGTDAGFEAQQQRFAYDPVGKRDPFRSFILDRLREIDSAAKGPLEQFDLSQLAVKGIVWDAERQRALVLDPAGQGYIIEEGDAIGKNDGRVIAIDDNVVVVREAYVDFHGERTTKEIEMHVRQSQGG